MEAMLRLPESLTGALVEAGVTGDNAAHGLVFAPVAGVTGWGEVRAELTEAFTMTARAAAATAPIVYVVHHDDLLGRRGAERAMVATALLSGARTAAVEMLKAGVPVNVLAVGDDTSPAQAAAWIAHLLTQSSGGVTGEVIRLGGGHIGKALP